MTRHFGFFAAFALAVALPTTASAGAILFDGPAAAWKPVNPASSTGASGYWDRRSYDSFNNTPTGACGAGTLVGGQACDWAGGVPPPQSLTNPRPFNSSSSQPLEYFGLVNRPAGSDAPLDFYFTGPFTFDWNVLFQLTGWDNTVEFGWYPANSPDTRNPIVGPGGPHSGSVNEPGTKLILNGDFGFYHRNTRYGSGPNSEIVFFTQSKYNKLGSYFSYFSESAGGIWPTPARTDDESTFNRTYNNARGFQQFVAFRQLRQSPTGSDLYWLGLEDQFGEVNPVFCNIATDQPCSDYDFNDFIINFATEPFDPPPPVPEPSLPALVASGITGVIWLRRRRR